MQLLATGETVHVICGRNGKPKLLPSKYRVVFEEMAATTAERGARE
jgi:acyl-CoA thioesterase FadM